MIIKTEAVFTSHQLTYLFTFTSHRQYTLSSHKFLSFFASLSSRVTMTLTSSWKTCATCWTSMIPGRLCTWATCTNNFTKRATCRAEPHTFSAGRPWGCWWRRELKRWGSPQYVPLVEFVDLAGESWKGEDHLSMYQWWSLCILQMRVARTEATQFFALCLYDVFRALINSLACWFTGLDFISLPRSPSQSPQNSLLLFCLLLFVWF